MFSTDLINYTLGVHSHLPDYTPIDEKIQVINRLAENNNGNFNYIKTLNNNNDLYWINILSDDMSINFENYTGETINFSITNEYSDIELNLPKDSIFDVSLSNYYRYQTRVQHKCTNGNIKYTIMNEDETFFSIRIIWSNQNISKNYPAIINHYRYTNYIDLFRFDSFTIEVNINNEKIVKSYVPNRLCTIRASIINDNGSYDIKFEEVFW